MKIKLHTHNDGPDYYHIEIAPGDFYIQRATERGGKGYPLGHAEQTIIALCNRVLELKKHQCAICDGTGTVESATHSDVILDCPGCK